MQAVLRAAARLILKKLKFDHISDDIRDELHWLPVKQRIGFKICMYVSSPRGTCLLVEHAHFSLGCRCSAAQSIRRSSRLDSSKNKNSALWRLEFCGVWTETWNALPAELKTPNISLMDFKRGLKTMLFKQEFA